MSQVASSAIDRGRPDPPIPGVRTATQARRREAAAGWLFSAPALAFLLAFLIVPFALAIWLSFTNQRLISPLPTRVVGLENFQRLFEDPVFRRALLNNLIFVVVVVPLQTALALGLAVAVNQRLRFMAVYRTAFFAPVVTVMAVAATIWRLLYSHDDGVINAILGALTAGEFQPDWLGDTATALPAIALMSIWQGVGFQMVIILAALQSIDGTLYEAAEVDGAGAWQRFRDITLPQLRNTLIFVGTITTILAFRLFDQVYVMTGGGPRHATETMMLQLVDVGFQQQKVGMASAIAVLFVLIVVGVTLAGRALIKEDRG